MKAEVSPEAVELILNSACYHMREHADTETKQPFINIVRQFIQKVVIGRTPGPPAGIPGRPRPDRLDPCRHGSGDHGEAVRGAATPRLSGKA
ncbi:hypothetical protein [Ensifer aridi]|uniref:hypothetical protein n=1 Tax=Ensifer aridi TaxID=1708715 RepID=UPI000412B1A9|nr:hypothetical protein [Ensifer aridi]